ncbi:phosphoglycerate mutase family protein [Aulographum hederae CBS 113979]|uniref:Phosphoglycerate mutase family protein n=1 Tax=Aulographum hederae CBS 113979 TaxID=1176131 RepID=A0A6G1H3A9_9PEZI|nr:phosphoglycerate mutase family protein [Aulographum hederae CBS 113979]
MCPSPAIFAACFLAVGILVLSEFAWSKEVSPHLSIPSAGWINYTTMTGFFLQDDPTTNASTFDYTTTNLGLINRTYPTDSPRSKRKLTQWEKFEDYVTYLNRHSARNVEYKVLYMGRHGEGYHNVAEAFYGTPAWDCYWSELDGNGTVSWDDARITPLGVTQAEVAHNFWVNSLKNAGIPAPQSYYTSPLSRCLETAKLTFSGLELPHKQPFIPIVKELLREALGVHTCDCRSSKSYIHDTYPSYLFEPGFAENDPLWLPNVRESNSQQVVRLTKLLDDVFTHDDRTWISFTSHSGSIGAILKAIGHRPFSLRTGAVTPVFVKAEWMKGNKPTSSIEPGTAPPTCTSNPTPSPTP